MVKSVLCHRRSLEMRTGVAQYSIRHVKNSNLTGRRYCNTLRKRTLEWHLYSAGFDIRGPEKKKIRVIMAPSVSNLLYGAESWADDNRSKILAKIISFSRIKCSISTSYGKWWRCLVISKSVLIKLWAFGRRDICELRYEGICVGTGYLKLMARLLGAR